MNFLYGKPAGAPGRTGKFARRTSGWEENGEGVREWNIMQITGNGMQEGHDSSQVNLPYSDKKKRSSRWKTRQGSGEKFPWSR